MPNFGFLLRTNYCTNSSKTLVFGVKKEKSVNRGGKK